MTRPTRMRAWLYGQGAVLAAVVACAAQGCGDSSGASPGATPAPQAVCPTTPEETIGASCNVEGLRCGPLYACGVLSVALLCECTGGAFACTNGTGQPVQTTDDLTCPGTPATGQCPTSERTAQLAACTEQGLLCSYPSSCPSMLDQCQCSAGTTATGAFGLRFECHPAVCADAGAAVVRDSGSPDVAARDSGTDASTSGDAAPGDAGDSAADAQDTGVDASPDAPTDAVTPSDAPAADAPSE